MNGCNENTIDTFITHCTSFSMSKQKQHTWGSILFLMKDPCAPIFDFSMEVFSLFTVLIPGLNKCTNLEKKLIFVVQLCVTYV